MKRRIALSSVILAVVAACGDDIKPPAPVEVTVSGLTGQGFVLQLNGANDLAVERNGKLTFPTPLAWGTPYEVTVATQPLSPAQSCSVSNGSGTITSHLAIEVQVSCETRKFVLGGTVTGLTGAGLVLQNGSEELAVAADGTFAFPTLLESGAAFDVSIKTQPAGPTQTCSVTMGSGTVAAGDVTTVAVDCTVNRYRVRGTVSGLVGTVVLQNNGGDDLPISANGTFAFAASVASGAGYAVTVLTQPTSPTQTCVVTTGAGTITNADITNVSVVCSTNTYTIGGTVSGLAGSGLVLRNNGGDDLPVAANGSFTFTTPISSGATFAVSVFAQPTNPWQTCTVTGGDGTVVSSNVTSVVVDCSTNHYTIGGTVSGLDGTGLQVSLNNGAPVPLGANGSYAFTPTLASGTSYTVTIVGQPQNNSQTCIVANDTGTVANADVTNVDIACTTNKYTIGGSVVGLAGGGLTLQNNNGDDLPISGDGAFTFATKIASGDPYAVTITAQPTNPWQTCVVTNAGGVVGGGNITDVTVTCTTNKYTVGGKISGLADTVVLQNNLGDNLTLNMNGTFTFDTSLASGSAYSVTVLTQPDAPSQSCQVTAGSGTITNANVTTVDIVCTTNEFKIGGTVTGLAGSGLVLRNNGGDDLPISGNGTFEFTTKIASGQTYAVTASGQPSSPTQTCTVTGDTGTVGGADVTSVVVNCTTNKYTIGGSLLGLGGATGLVLQNNLGDDLPLSADGTFSFTTPVVSGQPYSVTVKTQPTSPWETCTVTSGTGTVTNANITDVSVTCTPDKYPVKVTVTGLAGGGLVLRNNGADDLSIPSAGDYEFATHIASGQQYAVTVATQPTSPWQNCTAAAASGTMADGITVAVSCTTNTYTIGGKVSGLTGSGLVLRNNGGDDKPISGDGTYTFTTPVASGAGYAVTIHAQPSGQSCTVSSASGTVAGANVTNVDVSCGNHTIPGFTGQLGPDFSAAGYSQCVGYFDQVNVDDIPDSGWANACIGTGYNKIRVACGASASSVRFIDVSRNVLATGLNSYPETGLITNANFTIAENSIWSDGNQPNNNRSWWASGSGCNETAAGLTINNFCTWDAANCFGQNLSGSRYLYVYVSP